VTIVEVPATKVAVMAHRGDPALIGETIQRFIAWRKAAGLSPRTSATFKTSSIAIPHTTAPADFHLDLCVATDRVVAA